MKHLCREAAPRVVRFRVSEFGMKTRGLDFHLSTQPVSQDISNRLIRVGPQIACFAQTDK